MQNFGRAMWRRLNDYQTIQNMNQINIKNNKIQEYLAFQEYCKKKQQEINTYRQKILLEKKLEKKEEELQPFNYDNDLTNNVIVEFVENDIQNETDLKEELNKKEEELKIMEETKFVPKKIKKNKK